MENTFNLNEYLENNNNAMSALTLANENNFNAIVALKNQSIDVLSKQINELKRDMSDISNSIKLININQEEHGSQLASNADDIKYLKDKTCTLATDDGMQKELTKLLQALTYEANGNANTLEYALFHRHIINGCYAHIYNIYEVNSYKRINIEDYKECKKSVEKWFKNSRNIARIRNKKIKDLMAKDDNGSIKVNEKKLLDKILDKTQCQPY